MSSLQRNPVILPFVTTWMNLEDIMPSEVSQAQRDKYCIICSMLKLKDKTSSGKHSHGQCRGRGEMLDEGQTRAVRGVAFQSANNTKHAHSVNSYVSEAADQPRRPKQPPSQAKTEGSVTRR